MSASPVKLFRFFVIASTVTLVWVASLYLADFVSSNEGAQSMVSNFGYIGILVIAVISGINLLLPIPAATFVPVFTEAGLWLPFIVLMLVIGTTIADLIGYIFGRWSREFTEEHYPHTYQRVLTLKKEHSIVLLLSFVFAYAAVVPLPNEAVIIPLALIGIRFKAMLIPLMLGNAVSQTVLSLGAANLFALIFG